MSEYQWIRDDIFIVRQFFTPPECREAIERAERVGFRLAPISTIAGPMLRTDVRNNTRVMVDDLHIADTLWQRAREHVPPTFQSWQAVGVNERLRDSRYDAGEQFDWHQDGSFSRDNGDRSRLTFMIYLNEGFAGGATAFDDLSIAPEEGMALFFAHPLRHKGMPVLEGRKYVLRTDVMYRRS